MGIRVSGHNVVARLAFLVCLLIPGGLNAAGVVTECTQTALVAALEGGGDVSFDCGGNEIELSTELDLAETEVSIDGATDQGPLRLVAAPGTATRLIRIRNSATVSLRNLALVGGSADEEGGAIRNFGTLTLQAVAIRDSVAGSLGGGIANFGVLSATDIGLVGNRAGSVGGGLYNSGVAELARATVADNASEGVGGAIANIGRLALVNATVTGNQTAAIGAIFINRESSAGSQLSHVTLVNNRLSDETAAGTAGLFVDAEGSLAIRNTVITGNGAGDQCFLPGAITQVVTSYSSDESCGGFEVAAAEALGLVAAETRLSESGFSHIVYTPALPTVLLDAGDDAVCGEALVAAVDQLGQARPSSEACDVGAIELDVSRPVVDLNGDAAGKNASAAYAEGAGEQTLVPDAVVTGGDLALVQALRVQLDVVQDAAAESLAVDVGATGLTANYDGTAGRLDITGDAAPEDYTAVLTSLSYQYTGEILGDPDRLISVQAFGETLDSSVSTIAFRLEPINDDPIASDDAFATPADQVLTVAEPGLLSNDSDADAQTLTASAPAVSEGGAAVVVGSDGRLSFDPTSVYAGLADGVVAEDGFDYFVSDGAGGSDQGRVVITVTGVNDPPVATDDRFVLTEDGVVTSPAPGVLANDIDPDSGDSLTVVRVDETTSSGLAVSVATDGAVVFDPSGSAQVQGLRQGQVQLETVAYTVADNAGLQATGQLRFDIQGRNDAPVAVALGQERLFVDEAASLSIAAAFTDADAGDVLTYTAPGLPSSLALGTTSGVISGTPTESDVGRYALNVSAFDEAGDSATSQLVLVIERVGNDAPLIVAPVEDLSLDEGEEWTLVLSEIFEDPDGDVLTYAATGLPAGLTLTGDSIAGAAELGTAGSYNVVLTATDPFDEGTDTAFSLTITEPERDLAVTVQAERAVAAPEVPFQWSATVSNPGGSLAGGTLTLRISGAGLSVPVPDGCTRSVAVSVVTLDCVLETLAAGDQQTVAIESEADRAGGVWLQASVGEPATDVNPDDNVASIGVVVTDLLAEIPGAEFEVVDGTRLAVLDADGDGALDIAVGTGAGRATRLFVQTADKAFAAAGSLGDVGDVRALLAGNFDGQAGEDIVVVNASGGHALYGNTGNGAFALAPNDLGDGPALDALATDLDEDGVADIVILESDAVPRVYFSEGGDGFFTATLEPAEALSLGLADIDGDGRPEPVFGVAEGDVFQPTIGRRSFGARLSLPTAGVTHWLGADFDGDEDGDLLAARPEIAMGSPRAPELRLLRSQPRNVVEQDARVDLGLTRRLAAADLDADGDMDAVNASPNGVVQLYRNDGNGRLLVHSMAIEADAIDLVLADMDRDGDSDLVLLTDAGVVQVWFNQGGLEFSDTVGSPDRLHSDDSSGSFGLWALWALLAAGVLRVRRAGRVSRSARP